MVDSLTKFAIICNDLFPESKTWITYLVTRNYLLVTTK